MKNRREFLSSAAKGLALTIAGSSARLRAAQGSTPQQKFLVNFVITGGWDSHWSYSPISTTDAGSTGGSDSAPLQGALATSTAFRRSSSSKDITESADEFTNSNSSNGANFHIRFPNSEIESGLFSGGSVGPLLSHWSSTDASRFHIVRGLTAQGGHGIGNTSNQHGTSGSSTPSFSATVAYAEATRLGAPKPLHRVIVGNSLSSVYSSNGNLGGPANPIFIPSKTLFDSLVSPNATDPYTTSATRRSFIDSAVQKLSTELGSSKLSLSNSQDAFTSFWAAYSGVYNLFDLSTGSSTRTLPSKNTEYTTLLTAVIHTSSGHTFAKDWFKVACGTYATTLTSAVSSLAFRFALAEYLIENNLSSVIDIPGIGHDNHSSIDQECLIVLLEMEAMRIFMERLAAIEASDGSGRKLSDCTLLVAHTEFDRDKIIAYSATGTGGTQHWEYTTGCFFAGMGVNGGQITGDVKKPGVHTSGYSSIGNYRAMPISSTTGAVDPNGSIPSAYSIFPTVLSIFECSSLSQISMGANPFTRVLKG